MWPHWPNAAVLEKQNTGNYFFFAIYKNYNSSKTVSIKMQIDACMRTVKFSTGICVSKAMDSWIEWIEHSFKPFLIIQVAASLQSGLKKIRSRHSFLHVKKLKFMAHKNLCH